MTLRVGFDLDGVLYDFGNSVRRYLDSIGRPYGFKDGHDEPHTWNFFEYWGMDVKEFVQICHDGADAGFVFCGGVRPGAVEAVQAVKDDGHEIIVITDRQFGSYPEVSHEHTRNWWLENNFPEFDELHFSADKTIVPTDFYVEDKLENYDAVTLAGTPCFLITRPWNHDPVKGLNDGRRRIDDITDYADFIIQHNSVEKYVEKLLSKQSS